MRITFMRTTSGPRAIRLLDDCVITTSDSGSATTRLDQAKSMMGALAAGDENRGRIIRESIKGKLHEFTTR